MQIQSLASNQLLSNNFQWDFGWANDLCSRAHYIWICKILSPLQLYIRQISQNTFPTLCSRLISSSRLDCHFLEKSPKSPKFSSYFLLLVFTKIQPRLPRFSMISEVEFHDIILQLFRFWSRVSFYKVSLRLKMLKIANFGIFIFLILKRKQDKLSLNKTKVTTKY